MTLSISLGLGVGSFGRGGPAGPAPDTRPHQGQWSLYLDADDSTFTLVDTDRVAQWDTLEGATHATQSTSTARPTLNPTAFSGSRAGVTFSAATLRHLVADAVAAVITGDDVPFVLAVQVDADDVAAQYGLGGAGGAGTNDRNILAVTTTQYSSIRGAFIQSSGTSNASEHVIVMWFTGAAVTVYVDGTKVVTGAPQNAGVMAFTQFVIGCGFNTTSVKNQYLNGSIRRFALGVGALVSGWTDADDTEIRTFWSGT